MNIEKQNRDLKLEQLIGKLPYHYSIRRTIRPYASNRECFEVLDDKGAVISDDDSICKSIEKAMK